MSGIRLNEREGGSEYEQSLTGIKETGENRKKITRSKTRF